MSPWLGCRREEVYSAAGAALAAQSGSGCPLGARLCPTGAGAQSRPGCKRMIDMLGSSVLPLRASLPARDPDHRRTGRPLLYHGRTAERRQGTPSAAGQENETMGLPSSERKARQVARLELHRETVQELTQSEAEDAAGGGVFKPRPGSKACQSHATGCTDNPQCPTNVFCGPTGGCVSQPYNVCTSI